MQVKKNSSQNCSYEATGKKCGEQREVSCNETHVVYLVKNQCNAIVEKVKLPKPYEIIYLVEY